MKKIFFPILLLLCLTACKEDLTDYYTRLNNQEHRNDSLKEVNDALQEKIDAQSENEPTRNFYWRESEVVVITVEDESTALETTEQTTASEK